MVTRCLLPPGTVSSSFNNLLVPIIRLLIDVKSMWMRKNLPDSSLELLESCGVPTFGSEEDILATKPSNQGGLFTSNVEEEIKEVGKEI